MEARDIHLGQAFDIAETESNMTDFEAAYESHSSRTITRVGSDRIIVVKHVQDLCRKSFKDRKAHRYFAQMNRSH